MLKYFIRSRGLKIMGTFRVYMLSFQIEELDQSSKLARKEEMMILNLIYEPERSNEYFKHGENLYDRICTKVYDILALFIIKNEFS